MRCGRKTLMSRSGNAFAAGGSAAHASFFVALVIVGSVIAVPFVVTARAPANVALPANVINAVPPDDLIIEIASAPIVVAWLCVATAGWPRSRFPLRPPRFPPPKKT